MKSFLVQEIYIPINPVKSDQKKTKNTTYSFNGQNVSYNTKQMQIKM